MTSYRLVLGFYRSKEHAEEALHEARRNGIRRSGAVHRAEDGQLTFSHSGLGPLPRGVFGCAVALMASLVAGRVELHPGAIAAVALFAFLLSWFGTLWSGWGLKRSILARYGRLLFSGESVVAVQEKDKRAADVVAFWHQLSHVALFTIRPGITPRAQTAADRIEKEPVTLADLPKHAHKLASSHELLTCKKSRSLLPTVRTCEDAIERAREDLAEASRLDYAITPAAEWVLDNTYLIRAHIAEIRHNLPDNHYRILPVLTDTSGPIPFRVYHLATELVDLTGHRPTPEGIADFLDAYQDTAPLTIAELWVFPLMLRLVLLQRIQRLSERTSVRQHQKELADFWSNRLLNAAERSPQEFERVVSILDQEGIGPTAHFIARLGEQLHKEESLLAPIQKWIEEKSGQPLADTVRAEHAEEVNDLMFLSDAIGSLRLLSELQYPEIVESVSRMEAILRKDSAGIHAQSDFATRDRCRRVIEEVARQSRCSELDVAQKALELSAQGRPGSLERCTAYYLLDKGLPELEKLVGRRVPMRERRLRFIYRHPTVLYLGGLSVLTLAIAGTFLYAEYSANVALPLLVLLGALVLIPASELATFLLQIRISWVLPPRVLPKMSFEKGIPTDCRTLVVVPMMFLTPDAIRGELEKLEVRYLANPAENLFFSLLSDYTDAEKPEMPEDDDLLGVAIKGIEQLNARYSGDRFILFHRARTWCESEGRWIGWERKRGKLEELNALLNGETSNIMISGGMVPSEIRYVITLDADTQLPHGSARKLIETIAHPLNAVELTPDGRNRSRGYTIIQPRVSISLPSATATRFSRLFTDARGSDPYSQAVSDVYQDLFGEAIYHGKAIYDVRAFHKILGNRFPQQRLLSHDLIEGAYTGIALASDVELFEHFPYDYTTYSKRQHRWIRGDWQIASWVMPRVPSAEPGRFEPNPLSLINRWKIFDNLRRSLMPAAALMFLMTSWGLHAAPRAPSILIATMLLVPLWFQLMERSIQRLRGDARAWREANSDLNRAIVMAAFLPHQAYLSSDAAFRACYRLIVSKKHLLEWQTVELSLLTSKAHVDAVRLEFLFVSASSVTFLLALTLRGISWEFAWATFLLLWASSPILLHWIGLQRRTLKRLAYIEPDDQRYLRQVARETWRFFDDLVGPENNWLPPDNSQEALCVEVAERTSPTNIGMWFMSALSASDLGFITSAQMVERCTATFQTLEKLEQCEGHILNWYNTRTLEPLSPKYISTADSGNLIASLWVLAQATENLDEQPQLNVSALQGLADTLAVIQSRFPPEAATAVLLDTLQGLFQETSSGIQIAERIRLSAEPARKLSESLRWGASDSSERAYWFDRIHQQVGDWIQYLDRYLGWTHLLGAPPDEFLAPLGQSAILARQRLQARLPLWGEVARGELEFLELLRIRKSDPDLPAKVATWAADLETEYGKAQVAAQQMLAAAKDLCKRCESLANGVNMRFLYDAERSLFAIGYQVGGPVTFNAHYDLLASESRIGSLVAIAKGDVPTSHWLALGRPYTSSSGQVLLSWSGTMFEYLMPLLFTHSFRNSLLDNACASAVKRQIEYGRERGVPWGISESAYSAIDTHQIYQYRAFGVPSLGLKRGLEEELVVAPYATALALAVDPADSLANLRRLQKLGMLGRMAFYEALDFTRQQERQGEKGVIVYCYMAHHQGMSLMAINNVLNAGILRQRFHSDRRIKAVEPLLFERIPPQPSMLVHLPSDHSAIRPVSEPFAPVYQLLDEDTPAPRAHLLGNRDYSLMITNAGSGYSRWGDVEITRWRADTTRDNHGMFFYLRDDASNSLWSATHQPLSAKDPRYAVVFSADRAEFRRRRLGIESLVEVTVSPDDPVEIRRITLTNHGLRARKLELTSVVELSLAPHAADRAHPAFNKLFVQTEALPDLQALLAWRRLRSPEDKPVWVAQLITGGTNPDQPFLFETDRARILGRSQDWQNPALSLEQTEGYVLDPVFAIQRRVSIEPRQQTQIAFVTIAAASREEVLRLASKYCDPDICNRTFELAWSHSQLEHRYLGVQSDTALRFAELASYLLYPNIRMRAPSDRLRRNTLGQSRLWAYGISGDLPLAVVVAGDSQGVDLAREVLVAHTYWHLQGFKADLVILSREPSSYDQPIHQQLLRLVEAHSAHTGVDQLGRVFLCKVDQMPEEDVNLILTVAHAVLGLVRGTLSQQLSITSTGFRYPPLLQTRPTQEQPSAPLPFLELPYFNGLGGFTLDGREYAIYLGPNATTPTPWINVMANPSFGALVSESGTGCSWYANSQSNRLTPWNNDPVSDPAGEAIYIRDEESGVFWTPTPSPVRELDAYRVRHGQGYSEFEHNSHALDQTLVTFVPLREDGSDPIRVQRLRIKNRSRGRRRLSVTAYSEFVLGTDREVTQMHVISSWEDGSKALFARNPYHPDYGGRVAFASITPDATSYTGDRTEFLGRNGSAKEPAALRRASLSKRTGPGLDPCGALQTKFDLGPGDEITVVLLLGQADDADHARSLLERYRTAPAVEQQLAQTRQSWDELLNTIQVETPVLSVNFLMNRWLLYQSLSCRIWGRTALYQSSGAYGYRDQLQDALAVVYSAPHITRELILRAASRQFAEGDVQHWWHPRSGEGIRSRCSDDLLWLPFAVSHYVKVTGDGSILDATAPFLEAPLLKEGELETFNRPLVSLEEATIFEHCRRAIEKSATHGPHGLPLIGTGDWNDGLSSVGSEGKGESVWLAWFLIDVLNKFAIVCDGRGEGFLAQNYRERARILGETVEATSWDGEWYRRGYFDNGTPLGSKENTEARIDSLAQSWSVISGAGKPERSTQAMRSVDEHLVQAKEKMVLLFTPPFEHSQPHPGYIMGYPPGVRENGGQYTHGALWVAMAFARLGNGNRAVEILQMLNPIEHSRTPRDYAAYRTEPYSVAADVYSLKSQMGRGGWTWYTGSAGWMYRIWLEEVLGFQLHGDRLSIRPTIPEDWPGYTITFRYGRTTYRIAVVNGGTRALDDIQLTDDGAVHSIQVFTGLPQRA
ncbi:MAG: glucoamylase family protein [Bryobacteraceae bacterium]